MMISLCKSTWFWYLNSAVQHFVGQQEWDEQWKCQQGLTTWDYFLQTFSRFDRWKQQRKPYSENNMAVNYAELPSLPRKATGEAFSFNSNETTLGCQSPNNPTTVPIKPNVKLHQYLNMMNDNKCSTRVYFGLTVEEYQQLWKAKVSNTFLATSGKKATDWQCHHQTTGSRGEPRSRQHEGEQLYGAHHLMDTNRDRTTNIVQHQPAAEQQDDEKVVQRPSNRPRLVWGTNKGKLTPSGTTAQHGWKSTLADCNRRETTSLCSWFSTRSWSRTEINSVFFASVIFNKRSNWGAALKYNMVTTTPLFNIKALSLAWTYNSWSPTVQKSVCAQSTELIQQFTLKFSTRYIYNYIYICMGMVFGCFRYLFFGELRYCFPWFRACPQKLLLPRCWRGKPKPKQRAQPIQSRPSPTWMSHRLTEELGYVGVTKASRSTLGSNMQVWLRVQVATLLAEDGWD